MNNLLGQDVSYLNSEYARNYSVESYQKESRVKKINQEINSIKIEIERLKVKITDLTIEKININQCLLK